MLVDGPEGILEYPGPLQKEVCGYFPGEAHTAVYLNAGPRILHGCFAGIDLGTRGGPVLFAHLRMFQSCGGAIDRTSCEFLSHETVRA